MSVSPQEKATLNRILAIDWRANHQQRGSQLALFNEYLRRAGLWGLAMGWDDAHPIVSDMPGRLIPGIKATPVSATLMQQTLRTIGQTTVYERMLLTRVLDWAAICHRDEITHFDLPDLYEPLLLFFERGGWIDKASSQHSWDICGVVGVVERAAFYHDLEPLPLTGDDLDALDAEAV